jgi:hypothetical protein
MRKIPGVSDGVLVSPTRIIVLYIDRGAFQEGVASGIDC